MAETDSIPRIKLQDMFVTLKEFEHDPIRTFEDFRLKICANRKKSPSGDRYWATARDNATELQRLGLVTTSAFPKDRRAFDSMRDNKVKVTDKGRRMLKLFNHDRSRAYDELFYEMYTTHAYLQAMVKALLRGPLCLPVVTSAKEHVSIRYSSAAALTEDISRCEFDTDSFCANLERRLQRKLTTDEITQIREGAWRLGQDWAAVAAVEDPPSFAKKFLQKLNDVILPALFRSQGLPFDFKTHQSLWSFGREWRLWETTARHPDWDLRVVFRTASVELSSSGDSVQKLTFDSGLDKTRDRFLEKLFSAYQKLQQKGRGTFAVVDELRAIFCYDNTCQESVFDRLVSEHYVGSEEYELNMEIYRRSGQHGRPIRIGNRNIGLLRIIKKG